MTRAEQKQWVRNFTKSVSGDVLQAIKDGRVPESYSGHELSELMALKFDEASYVRGGVILDPSVRKSHAQIRKAVKNDYIVKNI